MKFAVFSDVHSNLEAFNTALDDMRKQNVEKFFCLGDMLGYGPKPIECIDLIMKMCSMDEVEVCLLGNHDQATLYDPEGFNHIAEEAVYWTREALENLRGPRARARWDFIAERPKMYRYADSFLFVHGSPRNPLNEYVFPEDVDDKRKMASLFKLVPKYCFLGHTHVPGVFVDETNNSGNYQYFSYKEIAEKHNGRYSLGDQKLLINVGSVGQPRDQNPESCYVVVQYEENSSDNYVEYHRVHYDVSKTQKEIQDVPRLAEFQFLWKRLENGR